MGDFAKRLTINVLLRASVVSLVLGALVYCLLPAYYSQTFPLAFGVLALVQVMLLWSLDKISRTASPVRLAQFYLGTMVGKMLLAMLVLGVAMVWQSDFRVFAVNFMLLYFVFLGFESWAFFKFEKYLKENKEKK